MSDRGISISIPHGYSKNSLPNKTQTHINIGKHSLHKSHCDPFPCLPPGIDIKDIPNVNDHDFSITINGFFLVRWFDHRLIIEDVKFGPEGDDLVPVDISLVSGHILTICYDDFFCSNEAITFLRLIIFGFLMSRF